MSSDSLPVAAAGGTVAAVWAAALAAAVLIVILSSAFEDAAWLGISLGGCTVLSLCIQLATQEKRGFVRRLGASVTGAVIILVVATGVVFLLH
jgi:hypothetical protein